MNETIAAVRLIHIIAGFLGFVVAPAALVAARSGAAYWRWGKLYFWAMHQSICGMHQRCKIEPESERDVAEEDPLDVG